MSEIERLTRWKGEALEVLAGWDSVHAALGRPGELGERYSDASLDEVRRLQEAIGAVRGLHVAHDASGGVYPVPELVCAADGRSWPCPTQEALARPWSAER